MVAFSIAIGQCERTLTVNVMHYIDDDGAHVKVTHRGEFGYLSGF